MLSFFSKKYTITCKRKIFLFSLMDFKKQNISYFLVILAHSRVTI